MSALFASAPRIVGDGIHDDFAGLQAALDGKPFMADDVVVRDATTIFLRRGTYRLTHKLVVRNEVALIGGSPLHHEMPRITADHNEDCAIEIESHAVCLFREIAIKTNSNKVSAVVLKT